MLVVSEFEAPPLRVARLTKPEKLLDGDLIMFGTAWDKWEVRLPRELGMLEMLLSRACKTPEVLLPRELGMLEMLLFKELRMSLVESLIQLVMLSRACKTPEVLLPRELGMLEMPLFKAHKMLEMPLFKELRMLEMLW